VWEMRGPLCYCGYLSSHILRPQLYPWLQTKADGLICKPVGSLPTSRSAVQLQSPFNTHAFCKRSMQELLGPGPEIDRSLPATPCFVHAS
jgi:hypothetical protein